MATSVTADCKVNHWSKRWLFFGGPNVHTRRDIMLETKTSTVACPTSLAVGVDTKVDLTRGRHRRSGRVCLRIHHHFIVPSYLSTSRLFQSHQLFPETLFIFLSSNFNFRNSNFSCRII